MKLTVEQFLRFTEPSLMWVRWADDIFGDHEYFVLIPPGHADKVQALRKVFDQLISEFNMPTTLEAVTEREEAIQKQTKAHEEAVAKLSPEALEAFPVIMHYDRESGEEGIKRLRKLWSTFQKAQQNDLLSLATILADIENQVEFHTLHGDLKCLG